MVLWDTKGVVAEMRKSKQDLRIFFCEKKARKEAIVCCKPNPSGGTHREHPSSLSLLTVMAGAAVAPALNVIQAHFAQSTRPLSR